MLASFAKQTASVAKYAVARQKRTDQNRLRYQNLLNTKCKGPWASRGAGLLCADVGGADFITAWMEFKQVQLDSVGARLGATPSPTGGPTADLVHIRGNQLAQKFSGHTYLDNKASGTANGPDISWSHSVARRAHNRTYQWLKACLRYNPHSPPHWSPPMSQAGTELARITMALMALGRTGQEHWAWPDNKSTLRHLRLSLEDGCVSCSRGTKLGNISENDGTSIDFSTCCL